MKTDIRQAYHPETAKALDTAGLRRHFLVETLFEPGAITFTYSHVDRLMIGGAAPLAESLELTAPPAIGTTSFLARRELGAFNVGGPGRVTVDGQTFDLDTRDAIYIGLGAEGVRFESVDAGNPARFYILSTPAHRRCETRLIKRAEAKTMHVGDITNSNKRVIAQYILPGVCDSCQLVMGMTQLEPGNMWNTMPCHVHDRRSEVYFYFDLPAPARVFHLMGEPQETRHIVVANEQAVISPGWSVHSGVGTSAYTFIWGMGGDNQDYTDMDMVRMEDLR